MAKRQDKESSRWERMVRRVKGKFQYIEANTEGYLISDSDIITLLRKEHLAVVRMVQQERDRSLQRVAESPLDSSAHNEASACWSVLEQLLAKLNERAK